jgi:hypothetical protein
MSLTRLNEIEDSCVAHHSLSLSLALEVAEREEQSFVLASRQPSSLFLNSLLLNAIVLLSTTFEVDNMY